MSDVAKIIPFCAFNGGNDVFVDIGDKSWGVCVCQKYFGGDDDKEGGSIRGERTMHVGDQFLSAGSNDFKARVVGTTAWIASPAETVELLDELSGMIKAQEEKGGRDGDRDSMEKDLVKGVEDYVDSLFKKDPMSMN